MQISLVFFFSIDVGVLHKAHIQMALQIPYGFYKVSIDKGLCKNSLGFIKSLQKGLCKAPKGFAKPQ